MAAQTKVQFTKRPAAGDPGQDAVRYAVNQAFEWILRLHIGGAEGTDSSIGL